jgi:hypothetical protein
VFQESILAVRSLNFTRSGVVWNCRTHKAPEWLRELTNYPDVEQVLLQPVSSDDTMGVAEFAEDSTYSQLGRGRAQVLKEGAYVPIRQTSRSFGNRLAI